MTQFIKTRSVGYLLLLLCGSGIAPICMKIQAQQMSPVIAEFNNIAHGAIQVTNNGDTVKTVSCQARGFDPDEHGRPQMRTLDPAMHVRVTSEKVVLAPKASRQISFDANPEVAPAWFLMTCTFMPVERSNGLTVAMALSSVVIIHGGQFDTHDVAVSAKRVNDKVDVEIKNSGAGMARVNSGEIVGHKKEADMGTFLLFPHQRRLAEVDWKETAQPETVRIQIGKQHLEAHVN
jgi:hypothetical protein